MKKVLVTPDFVDTCAYFAPFFPLKAFFTAHSLQDIGQLISEKGRANFSQSQNKIWNHTVLDIRLRTVTK